MPSGNSAQDVPHQTAGRSKVPVSLARFLLNIDRKAPAATAKFLFVLAGFLSFLFSVSLYFLAGNTTAGIFVGIWVPSIFSFGALVLGPNGRSNDGDRKDHK